MSAATQGPQAGAVNPQPGCQPALAVCREPLYRQKSPSREGADSGGSYEVPEVRGSRGRRVHATNSTAGATLVRARQDVKRARQASAPAHLSQTHGIQGGVLAVGGEVREGNGCSLSKRPEPGKKGRCSV